jgi:hypothetical protein
LVLPSPLRFGPGGHGFIAIKLALNQAGFGGKVKPIGRRKKELDIRPAARLESGELMKNTPLINLMLVALCGLAAVVVGLALLFELHFRQVRQLQRQIAADQNNKGVVGYLINDANEYSKTHPSIDALLSAYGAKAGKPANSGTAKPAGK